MSFKRELNNFLKNLEALELFVETQSKLIKPLKKGKSLSEKDLDGSIAVLETMSEIFAEYSKQQEDDVEIKNIKPSNQHVENLENLGVSFTQNEDGQLQIEFTDNRFAEKFHEAIQLGDLTHRQIELVYRNSLISLMMYFENLVSGIIKMRLKLFPDSFNPHDKTIKYSELIEFESLSDALEFLIDNEVVKIMYGGFKDWLLYLKKSGVQTNKMDSLTEAINEAHNRRNLFVHNDGIINSIYLKKVHTEYTVGLEKGKSIKITNDYIKDVIEKVKKYGAILLLNAWRAYQGSEKEERLESCERLAYSIMKKGEWDLAKAIYEFIYEELNTYGDKTRTQINIWLCKKELGYFKNVQEEIESYDVSGLQTQYHLCIASILEQNDKFFEMLDKEPNSLEEEYLKDWPVLGYVRTDERMKRYLKTSMANDDVKVEIV